MSRGSRRKAGGLLREGKHVVRVHPHGRPRFPSLRMCRLLGVTRARVRARGQTRIAPSKPSLSVCGVVMWQTQEIFNAYGDATYGSPRVRASRLRIVGRGSAVASKRRVERRDAQPRGRTPIAPRRHCKTTMRDLTQPAAPNALQLHRYARQHCWAPTSRTCGLRAAGSNSQRSWICSRGRSLAGPSIRRLSTRLLGGRRWDAPSTLAVSLRGGRHMAATGNEAVAARMNANFIRFPSRRRPQLFLGCRGRA